MNLLMPEVQTPKAEVPRVEINLSELYSYIRPEDTAAGILGGILIHYKGFEILAMLNFSPDVGMDVYTDSTRLYTELKRLSKIEDDEIIVSEAAKITNADLVIELYDGYEFAVAFLRLKK